MKIFWKNVKKEDTLQKDTFLREGRAGFTLVELLIVMVIVGTLVTIALPKYQNSLERGRALEGLRNAQYVAEYVNAKQMATGEWPDITNLMATDVVKSRFFGVPAFDSSAQTVTVLRKGTDWQYKFKATISDGAVSKIVCLDTNHSVEEVCAELDLGSGLGTQTGDNLLARQ